MTRTWGRALARIVVLLTIGLTTSSVHASETWYAVELIVFAPNNPETGSEHWPLDRMAALPALAAAVSIPATEVGAGIDSRIQSLPLEQHRLQAEVQRLSDSGNYTILLHTGWRQPGLAREEAVAVRLQSKSPQSAGPAAATASEDPTPATPAVLEGNARLILSRYLHLETDLRYRPEASAAETGFGFFASATPAEPMVYRLQETRRMRSKEIHYLDHPLFGVIALVTPYEVATPATTPTPRTR